MLKLKRMLSREQPAIETMLMMRAVLQELSCTQFWRYGGW